MREYPKCFKRPTQKAKVMPSLLDDFRSDDARKQLFDKIQGELTTQLTKNGVSFLPNPATDIFPVTFNLLDISLRQYQQTKDDFVTNIVREAIRQIKQAKITSIEMIEVWARREIDSKFSGYHLFIEVWRN
jgi:hypothetical protein